ncbi:MAG: hypothetical protein ACM3RQ_01195 [Methanocella sp.]
MPPTIAAAVLRSARRPKSGSKKDAQKTEAPWCSSSPMSALRGRGVTAWDNGCLPLQMWLTALTGAAGRAC